MLLDLQSTVDGGCIKISKENGMTVNVFEDNLLYVSFPQKYFHRCSRLDQEVFKPLGTNLFLKSFHIAADKLETILFMFSHLQSFSPVLAYKLPIIILFLKYLSSIFYVWSKVRLHIISLDRVQNEMLYFLSIQKCVSFTTTLAKSLF